MSQSGKGRQPAIVYAHAYTDMPYSVRIDCKMQTSNMLPPCSHAPQWDIRAHMDPGLKGSPKPRRLWHPNPQPGPCRTVQNSTHSLQPCQNVKEGRQQPKAIMRCTATLTCGVLEGSSPCRPPPVLAKLPTHPSRCYESNAAP